MNTPKLGQHITDNAERDAVHVAIAPMIAGVRLSPGEQVTVVGGKAYSTYTPVGVVDPFLQTKVSPGQKFWLFMLPGKTSAPRHDWKCADLDGNAEDAKEEAGEDSDVCCPVEGEEDDGCGGCNR